MGYGETLGRRILPPDIERLAGAIALDDERLEQADLSAFFGLPEEESWQVRAACAQMDPDEFFPEKGQSTSGAKRICAGCEVLNECLDYALENDEPFGIWGGLSRFERNKLKHRAA